MSCKKEEIVIKHTQFLIFTLFFFVISTIAKSATDTTLINTLTSEAYNHARKNTDWSISNAHQALSISNKMHYPKGIADASLALGASYLAKFNPNDSAGFYYQQALDLYAQMSNFTGQARACYGLSYVYSFKSNTQKAEEFGARSVEYFRKAGNAKEEVAALGSVIYLAKQAGNYEKALELSDKAIEIARSIKDTAQWANALNNKGNVLKDMFLLSPAIEAYFDAYRLWQNKKDSSGLAIAYGSIANAYFFEGDFRKSLEYNFKKLPITNNSENLWETNKTMNNIALAYSNLNKHDSALYYMQKSLNLAKKLNYPEGVANSYNNMASTFLKTENIDSALFYSSEAVSIAEKINSSNLAKYELNKAMAFEKQKKYNAALAIARKAYSQAKERNDYHTVRDASFLLNNIYFDLGQRDMAYPYLTEYIKLNDSITNMDYMRKVTRLDLQHKYETEQRKTQYEIDMLAKQNQLKNERLRKTWIVLLAILLLSIAGASISFLIIKNKNHRIEQMKLEIRNYLLNAEAKEKKGINENPLDTLIEKYGLTQREAEIMNLISTGIGNEEIAKKLFVSKNTVKFHIKNIFIKLDVKNRVQAMQKSAL
ncbi:MAG: LuxR family transcriptional regulator [Mariniphaga sp.]|jgi:DNA-binding CsgD family transcriptional regulator|nr:LuxR family transcriptional regulator [Mariniphaga sp.]